MGLLWVSHSTLIYTSESILCSTICVHSATQHNIHMYPCLECSLSVFCICQLVNMKFGSPAFKALQKTGDIQYLAYSNSSKCLSEIT